MWKSNGPTRELPRNACPRKVGLMRFAELEGVVSGRGEVDQVIDWSRFVFDSRQAQSRTLPFYFVAIRGSQFDGHAALPDLVQSPHLEILIVESLEAVPASYKKTVVCVESTRKLMSTVARAVFGNPTKRALTVGVTGTNGKTSTVHFLEQTFAFAGRVSGVLGTVDHHVGAHIWPTKLTTPPPLELFSRLQEMEEIGAKAFFMEVSSHALDQERAHGVDFDAAIFTSFSRDHLDYHGTLENYFQCKRKLFETELKRSSKSKKIAAFFGDDDRIFSEMTALKSSCPDIQFFSYGERDRCDYRISGLVQTLAGSEFELLQDGVIHRVVCPLIGRFQIHNLVGALVVAKAFLSDEEFQGVLKKMSEIQPVVGRLQRVNVGLPLLVVVDYAHTPDGLKSALEALRPFVAEGNSLWVVFGCGGERDVGKRPLMGLAAEVAADQIVITSDNPRGEDPDAIAAQILAGMKRPEGALVEIHRKEAIRTAMTKAKPGDVVLIAGKGHESQQEIKGEFYPFLDSQVAKEVASEVQSQ